MGQERHKKSLNFVSLRRHSNSNFWVHGVLVVLLQHCIRLQHTLLTERNRGMGTT